MKVNLGYISEWSLSLFTGVSSRTRTLQAIGDRHGKKKQKKHMTSFLYFVALAKGVSKIG